MDRLLIADGSSVNTWQWICYNHISISYNDIRISYNDICFSSRDILKRQGETDSARFHLISPFPFTRYRLVHRPFESRWNRWMAKILLVGGIDFSVYLILQTDSSYHFCSHHGTPVIRLGATVSQRRNFRFPAWKPEFLYVETELNCSSFILDTNL